jgi:large subunit ribosomal protein L25
MADVTLAAEVGRPLGSRATRRLRREGKIPGVIYGHGTDPVSVAVPARELRIALNGEAGANQLLSLETGSTTYLALAREMQRHPVAQTVTHVDFQIVRRDEVIAADVPIVSRCTTATDSSTSRCSRWPSRPDRLTFRPRWRLTSAA